MTSLGLRDLLAHNLRKLCAQEPSISSVCRTLDINRQQFNNYLSGRNLPNEVVVRQLCNFFEIEPYELFLPGHFDRHNREISAAINRFVSRSFSSSERNANLPMLGTYFVYFQAPFDPSALVRSFMYATEHGGLSTFTRVTLLPINASGRSTRSFARHEGIVSSNGEDVQWSGYNTRMGAKPSLLVGRRLGTPPVHYAGVGVIDTGNGTETAGFAITRAPSMSPSVMRSLGLVTAAETPATRVAMRAIEGYRHSFSMSYSSLAY